MASTKMSPTENSNAVFKPSLYLQDMAELEKVFQRFDANGDGKISAVELTSVLKSLGSEGTQEEVSKMMEEIDSDKDGFVNLEEFANFCNAETATGDGGDEELREAFEMYDQNHNGLISATELHQILTKLGEHCTVQSCQKMIASVDSDGDGSVSFEEFKHMMSKTKK